MDGLHQYFRLIQLVFEDVSQHQFDISAREQAFDQRDVELFALNSDPRWAAITVRKVEHPIT